MKFSNNYVFYPYNKALEQAIERYKSILSDHVAENDNRDDRATVQDNFTHTHGNFEQYSYSSNSLESARETLEAELTEKYREQAPLDWAATQNSLGNILAALGQQQRDDDLFKKAIQSFNSALEELNQENAPLDWAATQYNLGTATQALGRQLSDSKLLKKSVNAYTNALLEWTREQMPLEWALTMHQLGATFHTHGKLLRGNRTFQKSVVAYKNALAELDADNTALELAATHNNRGAVLQHLGESEENPGRLEEAIRSYERALLVCQEQQLPIHLAVMSKVNIATARGVLAELTKDLAIAQETADDFELIIELFHSACQPPCLKHCEQQLDNAQSLVKAFSGNE
jgi:tetratricopeptide (TPR) repeat protein